MILPAWLPYIFLLKVYYTFELFASFSKIYGNIFVHLRPNFSTLSFSSWYCYIDFVG